MQVRQAILYGAGDLRIEERTIDESALALDEVLVSTEVSALSTGTDLGNYLGDSTYVPDAPNYPRWVGYSNVGRVVATGAGVTRLFIGQRIFGLKPHTSAYVAKETELLVPIPAQVSSEQASLLSFAQLGLAALRQAKYETGENVVVLGLGVIGLCTLGLARAMGARAVGVANSRRRVEVAAAVGADTALDTGDPQFNERLAAAVGPSGADIVINTANTWDAYATSLDIVRYGGRVSLLGFPGRAQAMPTWNPLDPNWVYRKQLTLLGSGAASMVECNPEDLRFNLRRNTEYILDLMDRRILNLEPVISHRIPSLQMRTAYELAKQHSKDLVAVIFDWGAEAGASTGA